MATRRKAAVVDLNAPVVLQCLSKQRTFTVHSKDIVKIHKGIKKIESDRFKENYIIGPGHIVEFTGQKAAFLLTFPDFVKYGLDA